MANILKVHEQNTIQELAARGWSRRRIARELKLDRKTVRRYLRAAAKSPTISTPGSPESASSKSPISTPGEASGAELVSAALQAEAGRPSFCDAHRERIETKLEAGLSAQRIYQDLVGEVGFSGSYQSVKRFVHQLRQAQPQRVWRIEVQPGEEAQIDFGAGAPVTEAEGRRRRPWVLRAAVQQADWCDPVLNPKVLSFCRHYGCALMPCRPRTPEHKGKTERGIGYLKANALRGRTFTSLTAENEFLRHWEQTVADVL